MVPGQLVLALLQIKLKDTSVYRSKKRHEYIDTSCYCFRLFFVSAVNSNPADKVMDSTTNQPTGMTYSTRKVKYVLELSEKKSAMNLKCYFHQKCSNSLKIKTAKQLY